MRRGRTFLVVALVCAILATGVVQLVGTERERIGGGVGRLPTRLALRLSLAT